MAYCGYKTVEGILWDTLWIGEFCLFCLKLCLYT